MRQLWVPAARQQLTRINRRCAALHFWRRWRSSQAPRSTVLHDFHLAHGARMVPFAGWSMPVQYGDLSIINSTLHTREHTSLFDVSHMLQMEVTGTDAQDFLERVTVADVQNLPLGSSTLSLLTSSSGGIIDDCIVTRTGTESFFIVANAGCAEKDLAHLNAQLREFKGGSAAVNLTPLEDRSLLALQGPQMSSVLQQGVSADLSALFFMSSAVMEVFGVPGCRVSRCGYTGEDGVEVSVPSDRAVELAELLLSFEGVKLAGLGARDTLRLEAGLCLYGNDITHETTPIEAGLAWCISKRRRKAGGFLGDSVILQQLKDKPTRRRVGLTSTGPPARSGAEVLDSSGEQVGLVTSGCPSPVLGCNIAMAYVPKALSKTGTKLQLRVRKNVIPTKVVKMPFVPSNYYTKS